MNPFLAVSYALTSAVLFAVFSVLARKALVGGTAYAGVVISLLVGMPMLGGLSLVFSSWEKLTLEAAAWFALGGLLAPGFGRLLLFLGIRYVGVGRAMPLITVTPFFSTLLGVAFLGERPGTAVWVGTAGVVAGCALLSLKPPGDAGWRRVFLLLPLSHALVLAVASGIRRHAMVLMPDPVIGALIGSVASLPSVHLMGRFLPPEERFRVDRSAILGFLLMSVVNTLGFLLFFTSFRYGEVWLVVPLGYSAPLFALLFARFWLREEERVTWHKWGGAVLLFLGMAVIVWQAA